MFIKIIKGKLFYHFNIQAKNNQTVLTSETYYSRGNCLRAAKKAAKALKLEIKP